MTRDDVIAAICQDNSINVLASVVTAWHAMGVEAWVLQQEKMGRQVKGFVIMEAHPVSGRLLQEEDFPISSRNGLTIVAAKPGTGAGFAEKLRRKIRQYGYFTGLAKSGSPLFYLKPVCPDYDLIPRLQGRDVTAVMLDEGLGSYANTPAVWLHCIFKESGKKEGIKAIYTLFVRDRLWKRKLQKWQRMELFQLLERDKDQWRSNPAAAALYRQVMEEKTVQGDFSAYEGAVVINTDVNPEMGNIREDEDLRVLQMVCNWCKKHQIPAVIKPHPRERRTDRYEMLQCQLETGKNGIAQELIFAKMAKKPLCTVSMASTTLVSSRVFFDIPGIALNRLLDWDKISVQEDYRQVNKLLCNFVEIPEDGRQLEEELDRILAKWNEGQA